MKVENIVYMELNNISNDNKYTLYKWGTDDYIVIFNILRKCDHKVRDNLLEKYGYYFVDANCSILLDTSYIPKDSVLVANQNIVYNNYYEKYKELNREYNLKEILYGI